SIAARPASTTSPRMMAPSASTRRAASLASIPLSDWMPDMPDLKLTLACWDYDRTRPLMDGRVKPEGIDLDVQVLRPHETFKRMLTDKEFHASELSLASYTGLKGRGDCPFVAIPVALSRIFRHSCIYVRSDAGIRTPQDLKGKRVGTTQYGATALVFIKGMLNDDHGVAP